MRIGAAFALLDYSPSARIGSGEYGADALAHLAPQHLQVSFAVS